MKNHCLFCTLFCGPAAALLLFGALLLSLPGCDRGDGGVQEPGFMVIDSDISNHRINAFAEDRFGYVWIATRRGLNRYNGFDFHQFYNTADSLSLFDNQVMSLLVDSRGDVWAGTVNVVSRLTNGMYFENIPLSSASQSRYVSQLFETSSGEIMATNNLALERYDRRDGVFRQLVTFAPGTQAIRCYEDPLGRIWIVSRRELSAYNIETMQWEESISLDFRVRSSFAERDGILWLMCSDGRIRFFDTLGGSFVQTPAALSPEGELGRDVVSAVYEYSPTMRVLYTQSGRFLLYDTLSGELLREGDADFPFTPPATDVTTMFADSKQNLWIGSSDQGFTVVNRSRRQFNDNVMLARYFEGRSVISLSSDAAGNVWALTSLEGLHMIDRGTMQARRIEVPGDVAGRKMSECFIDRSGNFWITFEDGRITKCRYRGGDRLTPEAEYNLGSFIFCVVEDTRGNIWAGAYGSHVCVLAPGQREFRRIEIIPPGSRFTPIMLPLRDGRVLAASVDRGFEFIDPVDESIERIDMRDKVRRSTFVPISLFEAADGTIWCGTLGNGLFTVDGREMTVTHRPGTQCDEISSIAPDQRGNLWISTLDGIMKYDPTVEAFLAYHGGDGIGGDQFNENCALITPDGSIIFGGTHGITFFDPLEIVPSRSAEIVFEDLVINNVVQQPYKSDAIESHLALKPEVTLRHGKNNFSISYVSMEFGDFPRNNYHYMLDGFDSDWIDARHNRQASYSNLPAGRYDLRVRAINNSNMSVMSEESIRVVVRPSPWLSGVMVWGLYPLLVLLLAGTLLRLWAMAVRDRHAAEMATIEMENEVRTNKMNMYFFSNISHEFRTPLTMISGPVEMLASDPAMERDKIDLLAIVRRNVDRMLRLVDQLMDFNKLENDTLRLKVREADVVGEVRRIVNNFLFTAKEKRLSLCAIGLEDSLLMLLDEDKLDKILYNLLSNAVKFTPPEGRITLSLDVVESDDLSDFDLPAAPSASWLRIDVADTGVGIPREHLEDVFKRYYQVSSGDQSPSLGTGIGLYYSRRLAELHHGRVKAFVRDEGGALLSVILPLDAEVYARDRRRVDQPQPTATPPAPRPVEELSGESRERMRTILVVEDDAEVVHFLKSLLSPYYNVVERFDAASGLEVIEQIHPDLILSDVVMPGGDGYELCVTVKSNIEISHIPVVLLTAKSTVADQVAGLDAGADAYVVKPFDPSYLLALTKSLLSNRDKLRGILLNTTNVDKIDEQMLSLQDKEFMDNLYALMEKELSNSELNVTTIARALRISRTKFYSKIKGLTGENPNVFFRTYKLNRAAELLRSGRYNISEVADITGFSTPSHFSVSFKKQFDITPSHFRMRRG